MAYDPLEVFPLPVWECILEDLRKQGSSRDVLNCSKVCTEFERILEPTKREWLFGSICQFIFPYLKGRELLTCRRVCKNWCSGVNNFLEDFETWRPFDEGTSDLSRSFQYDPLKQKKIKWTKLKSERRLTEFLEAMKKGEMKTPFVGRSVALGGWDGFECRGGAGSEVFERALELLSLCGDQIWHLRIVLPEDFISCHFIQILKQILACTPNLKSLILDSSKYAVLHKPDKIKLKNLQLEDHPLPDIISLETLEIKSKSTPIVILEKLISNFNLRNLKCLKLHTLDSNFNVEPYAVVRPLQHLTELHLFWIHWRDFEHICNNMISPTAPLGKLIWDFPPCSDKMGKDFDRMVNIINRWKGTLRMLAIDGYVPGKFLPKLDTPNIRSLELEGREFGTDILPPALTSSLEYLHIRYYCGVFDDAGKEFYNCVFNKRELHNSSIWSEMRKLKVIRALDRYCQDCDMMENVVCSKEMHECGIRAEITTVGCQSSDEDD